MLSRRLKYRVEKSLVENNDDHSVILEDPLVMKTVIMTMLVLMIITVS